MFGFFIYFGIKKIIYVIEIGFVNFFVRFCFFKIKIKNWLLYVKCKFNFLYDL